MLRFILSIAVLGTLSCSKDVPVSPPYAGKAIADDVASDRAALEVFYKATDGDNWRNNTNWLSENPLDSWHGVVVSSTGRVYRLLLQNNKLTGTIPPELGQLTNLRFLDLAHNQLTGMIPPELGQLTNLEVLGLRGNQFTGCIPNTLRNLPLSAESFYYGDFDRLGILFCGEDDQLDRDALIAFYNATGGDNWSNKTNWLTDAPLDEWHGVDGDAFGRVIEISLVDNGLQGAIPAEIKELTSLKKLWLAFNQLTDVTEVGNLTSLTMLSLSGNPLGEQTSLESLFTAFQGSEEELSESGSIPSTFAQLTNLQLLWFSNNQIVDISLLENLTNLRGCLKTL